MSRERCQACAEMTNEPTKVIFRGWNNELKVPAVISVCPRCVGGFHKIEDK